MNASVNVNASALFMSAMAMVFCGFWHATKVMHFANLCSAWALVFFKCTFWQGRPKFVAIEKLSWPGPITF